MTKKFLLLFVFILCAGCNSSSPSLSPQEKTVIFFEEIKYAPTNQLHDFLYAMPKGADLHSHLSGAVYAENLISYGQGEGFCIDTILFVSKLGTGCQPYFALDNLLSSPDIENATIDAWSMRNFNFASGPGHDHFFATFNKFDAVVKANQPQALAEVLNRAGSQHIQYLELMLTVYGRQAADLATTLGWNSDLNAMYDKLISSGQFPGFVVQVHQTLSTLQADAKRLMLCGTAEAQAGCQVEVKFLYQVARAQAPERVFAQFLLGLQSASQLSEVVGINLVQPEDNPIALSDYTLHMQMVQFLKNKLPTAKVSLHAGELTAQFVPEQDLSFHITSAVDVAGANRIGHGVDVMSETNYQSLLQRMATNQVLVEINLTSNQAILSVDKTTHPFPTYLSHKVPTALSTDDEGILRTNLTAEYVKAAQDYNLDYVTVKNISRNGLAYSFLPGESLWRDNGNYQTIDLHCAGNTLASVPNATCQHFLDSNEKARVQWNLEKNFSQFEEHVGMQTNGP